MITLNINSTAGKNVPVFLTKIWTPTQVKEVLQALQGATKIAFFDTPPSAELIQVISMLRERGCQVFLTDHHDVRHPSDASQFEITTQANALRGLCNALISTKNMHQTCTALVAPGDYSHFDAIVADPGPDGFWSAMLALGRWHGKVDLDAQILESDRFPELNPGLTELGKLLAENMAFIRVDTPTGFECTEEKLGEVYRLMADGFLGSPLARLELWRLQGAYNLRVHTSRKLLEDALQISDGCWLVDTRWYTTKGYDLPYLLHTLEQRGAKLIVLRQYDGEIAARHNNIQYRVQATSLWPEEKNLLLFLPPVFNPIPQFGIETMMPKLVYVNEKWWAYMQAAGVLIA